MNNQNREVAIRLSGVKKKYKLGQIGGGTLTADLQSWWARVRGKEDPNSMIGTDQRLIGQTEGDEGALARGRPGAAAEMAAQKSRSASQSQNGDIGRKEGKIQRVQRVFAVVVTEQNDAARLMIQRLLHAGFQRQRLCQQIATEECEPGFEAPRASGLGAA